MKCRPWRWLWGLLPLALIIFLTTVGERQGVERDLTIRTGQALESEGLGWARLRFEGRDGVLLGAARNDDERLKALEIARNVRGVRLIRDKSDIEAAVSPFDWQARIESGRIVLSGHVADDITRTAVVSFARKQFKGVTIDDQMKRAAGAPDPEIWGAGMRFALRQLARLAQGSVSLNDTTLEVTGRAMSPIGYKRIVRAYATQLPGGITLGKHTVAAPTVAHYEWSFDRLGDIIVLNGYVPDDQARKRLNSVIRDHYRGVHVSDRMLIASGAPEGFEDLARASLDETRYLDEVRVVSRDRTVTVTGLAANQLIGGDAVARIASRSAGFDIVNKLRARIIVPPRADPFEWTARMGDGVVVISGSIPDESSRAEILQKANNLYPGIEIRDEMAVASGVPGSRDQWVAAAVQGLSAMALLDDGHAELSGKKLRVSGDTSDKATKTRSEKMLADNLAAGFEIAGNVRLQAMPEPETDQESERKRLAAEESERKRKAAEATRLRLAGEAEARRQTEIKAAELRRQVAEANRERLVASRLVAEAKRKKQEAELEAERRRVAMAAAIAAEKERKRKEIEETERKRKATLALGRERKARALDAQRQARRKEYRLVSEFNGTPLGLWLARNAAREANRDPSTIDEAPFRSAAAHSRGKLILTGKVGSIIARDAIMTHARSQFDGVIIDNLEIINGAPDKMWLENSKRALTELSRLRNGALVVTQSEIQLYGSAVSGDAATAVRNSIGHTATSGFRVSSLVTAPRALKRKEVEVALNTAAPVDPEVCGNLMNSLTKHAPIRFGVDATEIDGSAYPTLDKLALVAQKCPGTHVRIMGHTDSNGSEEYNQELSDKRATAVLMYLASKGVDGSRMSARGLGETQPLVSNTTPEERAKNRRIEFSVTKR